MKLSRGLLFILLIANYFTGTTQVDCAGSIPENYSGKCTSYYPNGAISLVGKYKKGKKHGTFEGRYPTGEMQMKAKFKEDKPVGEMLTFFVDGTVSSRALYGDERGELQTYHSNGNLKSRGNFTSDGLIGIWYTYNDMGLLEDSTDFSQKETREIIDFSGLAEEYDPYQGDEELRKRVRRIYEGNEEEKASASPSLSEFPDKDAEFPGGNEAMFEFIRTNVWYPIDAIEKKIQGVVQVTFVVESDGTISHLAVSNGVHELLDLEAIRLVLTMPNWIAAEIDGRKVATRCRLPIRFRLD